MNAAMQGTLYIVALFTLTLVITNQLYKIVGNYWLTVKLRRAAYLLKLLRTRKKATDRLAASILFRPIDDRWLQPIPSTPRGCGITQLEMNKIAAYNAMYRHGGFANGSGEVVDGMVDNGHGEPGLGKVVTPPMDADFNDAGQYIGAKPRYRADIEDDMELDGPPNPNSIQATDSKGVPIVMRDLKGDIVSGKPTMLILDDPEEPNNPQMEYRKDIKYPDPDDQALLDDAKCGEDVFRIAHTQEEKDAIPSGAECTTTAFNNISWISKEGAAILRQRAVERNFTLLTKRRETQDDAAAERSA